MKDARLFVPHVGWFIHSPGDDVARFLDEGWYEYREQAFVWLYARSGDVFIDCGAHFGLYSALYMSAAGRAAIWAIEPNPTTRRQLARNLLLRGNRFNTVPCAVSSVRGEASFYSGPRGKAAYGGLKPSGPDTREFQVPCITLDELCHERGIAVADFVKLDIEGAEIDALRGASGVIADRRFPVVMVEFTEENLGRSGLGTGDLYKCLEAMGYTVCRFDEERLELTCLDYTGPVWYDNYFGVRDRAAVNARLHKAPRQRRRIAEEVIRRGATCNALRSPDAQRRLVEAESRAEQALRVIEASYGKTGEANWRADEANRRAEQTLKLLEDAYGKTGEANWRADEANRRVEQALKLLEDAQGQTAEANRRTDEANRRLEELAGRLEEANAAVVGAREVAALRQQEFERLWSTMLVRFGRTLRLIPRPAAETTIK